MDYSVLMSVYAKDHPAHFKTAIESMLRQTVPPAQIVVVCDGPLTPELDAVIGDFGSRLDVVRIPENHGPGYSRAEAMQHCRCELIASMDSDDISVDDRCEKELAAFKSDPELAVISGTIEEFDENPDEPFAKRVLPLTQEEILQYSKTRIPFNHVATMFRKSVVDQVGGYDRSLRVFEDYDLWIKVLKSGAKAANLSDVLVKVRCPSAQTQRRGGVAFGKQMLRFRKKLLKSGWINRKEYFFSAYPHFIVCIMPNFARRFVYKLLRK